MRFAYHDLSPHQFEELVVMLCYQLLGSGVQSFTVGPDGGQDAKFVGIAQDFPSKQNPLSGITVVQAKHTIDAIGKFSDTDFSGPSASSVLSKEIPRIKVLRDIGNIDHYLLFSNRRLAGVANEQITERLTKETGVPSIHLFGIERMEMHIKHNILAREMLRSFEYSLPLRASPDALAEVINALAKYKEQGDWHTSNSTHSLERVAFKKKNTFNGLSEEFADYITKNYLSDFYAVEDFLTDPINGEILGRSYRSAVDEFSAKLIVHRSDFETYDKMLEHLISTLIERDGDLRSNRRLARTVFYFMYWSCDIGETKEKSNASST